LKPLQGFDASVYPRAVVLLARNPQIVLGPLLAAVAQVLLFKIVPVDGGALGYANSALVSIIAQLISAFGLAVAIVAGEDAWRFGKAPFESAYAGARRRAQDILIAAIGYSFLLFIAGLVGGALGAIGSIVLVAVASLFSIYMERVRNAPLPAVVVAALSFVASAFVPSLILTALQPFLLSDGFFGSGDVASLIVAIAKAVMSAYVALVLAKLYGDASYGRYRGF
jgi:hypothetical protein